MDMETNRAMEVVGIGVPYYDMVINVSKMPGLDGAAGANEAFYQGGGKVATAMAAAARLGRRAGIIAKVGENHRGRFVIEDFRYNGVDTSAVIVDAPGTSSPFCLSLSEEEHKTRIFIGKEGTAGELQPEEIDYSYLGKAKYLHLEKLTPTVLNDMVNAVYVHAPDKSSGHRVQDVEISYNYIGILPANLLYDIQKGKTA